MGREIRRVPPDWVHPQDDRGHYIPLYDQDYESVADEWEADYALWREGKHLAQQGATAHIWEGDRFWGYHSPPDPDLHRERKWTDEEATAYQVYETATEGTPISPVFPTLDELRAWLIAQGHSEYAADKFIEHGSVMTMLLGAGQSPVVGIDAFDALRDLGYDY